MPLPQLLSALGAITLWAAPRLTLPIWPAEALYARIAVKLTLWNGGDGRYGRIWGVWHRARLTPGLGFYQPDFQCAEYVMRCLRAGGLPVPTPPPTSPDWPNLVNVDRILMRLESRGWAEPVPLAALRPGDVIFFRFLQQGPDRFSHTALVLGMHPLVTAAHDRNRWNAPLTAYPPAVERLGLHVMPDPKPPDGLLALGATRWVEVALRDPPLHPTPTSGLVPQRLYLGHLAYVLGAVRAPGSRTGWLDVASGPRMGYLNGDFATRIAGPVRALDAGDTLYGYGMPTRTPVPVALRGAWGRKLYVDAFGCPVPAWTGTACPAPFAVLRRDVYPVWQVTARHAVLLTRSPAPGSVPIVRMRAGTSAAAEHLGAYAAVFEAGGPQTAWGVLYAPANAFTWRAGSVALFTQSVRLGQTVLPPETAASIAGNWLTTPLARWPLPAVPPPGLLEVPPCTLLASAPTPRARASRVASMQQALCALTGSPAEPPLAVLPAAVPAPVPQQKVVRSSPGRPHTVLSSRERRLRLTPDALRRWPARISP